MVNGRNEKKRTEPAGDFKGVTLDFFKGGRASEKLRNQRRQLHRKIEKKNEHRNRALEAVDGRIYFANEKKTRKNVTSLRRGRLLFTIPTLRLGLLVGWTHTALTIGRPTNCCTRSLAPPSARLFFAFRHPSDSNLLSESFGHLWLTSQVDL